MQNSILVLSATLLGAGAQFVGLGLVAELITAYLIRPEEAYSVAETIGGPATATDDPPHP